MMARPTIIVYGSVMSNSSFHMMLSMRARPEKHSSVDFFHSMHCVMMKKRVKPRYRTTSFPIACTIVAFSMNSNMSYELTFMKRL